MPKTAAMLVMLNKKGRPQQNRCIKLPKITKNVEKVFNIMTSAYPKKIICLNYLNPAKNKKSYIITLVYYVKHTEMTSLFNPIIEPKLK